MPHDHPADAAGGVVLHAGFVRGLQQGFEFGEDAGELFENGGVVLGVLLEQSDGVGGVGFRFGVLVCEAFHEER